MSRELLILRHAKSDWRVDCSDFDRPLKKRGIRNAKRMGLWLQQQQIIPDLILSSPAERAISTTEKLCKAMGLDVCMIQQEKHLYAAGVKTLKNILAGCSKEAKRVMLVGHNPELEILLMNLAGNQIKIPDDGKLLATATLARLQMPGDWHVLNKGCAKVLSITRAASLP